MFPLKDNIPNQRRPIVTIALVVVNVVAYVISIWHAGDGFLGDLWSGPSASLVVRYGAIPYEFSHPGSHCVLLAFNGYFGHVSQVACSGTGAIAGAIASQPQTWVTAFTSMFLHASFLHIAGNMLFLAIFGPSLEDTLGHAGFLAFYLVGGLIALAAQILVDPGSMDPTLGASGAIAAVLGGYIVLFPRARILTVVILIFFFTLVELPALVLLGLWFVVQLVLGAAGLTTPLAGGGVAYFAHIGGFVFGLGLVWLLVRLRRAGGAPPALPA